MPQPTKTTNRLHFSDLNPTRFEDLCLNIVSRLYKWKSLNHYGRQGSDGGTDIVGLLEVDNTVEKWAIQCKRQSTFHKADVRKIIDTIVSFGDCPDKLLIIVSCDASRSTFEFLRQYAIENGIKEYELWTASRIESLITEHFKDLLLIYFNINLQTKPSNREKKIKDGIKMEKKITKELMDHKFIAEHTNGLMYLTLNPHMRFISHKVYVRSVDDSSYPHSDNSSAGISSWFISYIYDFYHSGLEFWIDAGMGKKAIMDDKGNWELLENHYDSRQQNPKYNLLHTKMIGRIPYYNIVDLKTSGDEYSSEPHIFCRFDFEHGPFETIYYKSFGNPEKEIPDWTLNNDNRTDFPQE